MDYIAVTFLAGAILVVASVILESTNNPGKWSLTRWGIGWVMLFVGGSVSMGALIAMAVRDSTGW